VTYAQSCLDAIRRTLGRYGITPVVLSAGETIPGSYWGENEAGLIGDRLYLRSDTPLHSVLHEASHFVCMGGARREQLDRDAGGDYDEENAVCYLQILLADEFTDVGRTQMCRDMDAWGYTFRLGSAQAWFEGDANDARCWLVEQGIIGADGSVTWRKRA
jgi:hypothetical protein